MKNTQITEKEITDSQLSTLQDMPLTSKSMISTTPRSRSKIADKGKKKTKKSATGLGATSKSKSKSKSPINLKALQQQRSTTPNIKKSITKSSENNATHRSNISLQDNNSNNTQLKKKLTTSTIIKPTKNASSKNLQNQQQQQNLQSESSSTLQKSKTQANLRATSKRSHSGSCDSKEKDSLQQQQQQAEAKTKTKKTPKPNLNLSYSWFENEKYKFNPNSKNMLLSATPPPTNPTQFSKQSNLTSSQKKPYVSPPPSQKNGTAGKTNQKNTAATSDSTFLENMFFQQQQNGQPWFSLEKVCYNEEHHNQSIQNICMKENCEYPSRLLCNLCSIEGHFVHSNYFLNILQVLNAHGYQDGIKNWPLRKEMQQATHFQDPNQPEGYEEQIRSIFQIFRASLNKQLDTLEHNVLEEYHKQQLDTVNLQSELENLLNSTYNLSHLKNILLQFSENLRSYKETHENLCQFAQSQARKSQEQEVEDLISTIKKNEREIPRKRQTVNTLQLKLCEKIKQIVEKFDAINVKSLFQHFKLQFYTSSQKKFQNAICISENKIQFFNPAAAKPSESNNNNSNSNYLYQAVHSDVFQKNQCVKMRLRVKSSNFGQNHIIIGIIPDGAQFSQNQHWESKYGSQICISCCQGSDKSGIIQQGPAFSGIYKKELETESSNDPQPTSHSATMNFNCTGTGDLATCKKEQIFEQFLESNSSQQQILESERKSVDQNGNWNKLINISDQQLLLQQQQHQQLSVNNDIGLLLDIEILPGENTFQIANTQHQSLLRNTFKFQNYDAWRICFICHPTMLPEFTIEDLLVF